VDASPHARPVARLASFVLGLASCTGVYAGTGTLTASTSVDTFCTVGATALAFGAYDPILANKTAALNGTASISIACVKGTSPTIALGLGANASGAARRMKHATKLVFLTYELFKPPSTVAGAACTFPGTVVWGSAGANLFSPGAAPSKNSRTFNVCGTVPAGQNVEVGSYSDTVVVTVNF
jgi:spore coat protein U domain-containing protein, fimbrial subunit CupE1/2/3/6